MEMVPDLICVSRSLHCIPATILFLALHVGVEALGVEVSGRIQDIHEVHVAVKIYSGFLLHLFFKPDQVVLVNVTLTGSICCESLLFTLGKPFDSCGLPGLIISGGAPYKWNAVGHHLLNIIIEGGPQLMYQCVSGITGIK